MKLTTPPALLTFRLKTFVFLQSVLKVIGDHLENIHYYIEARKLGNMDLQKQTQTFANVRSTCEDWQAPSSVSLFNITLEMSLLSLGERRTMWRAILDALKKKTGSKKTFASWCGGDDFGIRPNIVSIVQMWNAASTSSQQLIAELRVTAPRDRGANAKNWSENKIMTHCFDVLVLLQSKSNVIVPISSTCVRNSSPPQGRKHRDKQTFSLKNENWKAPIWCPC